jgi:hypothetical protein
MHRAGEADPPRLSRLFPDRSWLQMNSSLTYSRRRSALASFAAFNLALLLLVSTGLAKEPIEFFGGAGTAGGEFSLPAGALPGVAINQSGIGPANVGDVYVADPGGNRIQRFGRDQGGTPGDASDDTYFFISAWGADVDSTPSAGSDYEVCTVAPECKAAVASAGNESAAGNGSLSAPSGLAIDQDTGDLYVSDSGNHRVNVYAGDGAFLRSFGFDVVESGPGQIAGPDEQQQLTVKASGGKFSLSFAGNATGGRGIGRTQEFSNLIEVSAISGPFAVGQAFSASAPGFPQMFPAGTTVTDVGTKTITVSQPAPASVGGVDLRGDDMPFNSSASQLETALNMLPSIGGVGGSVTVSGGPGDLAGTTPYVVTFGGSLSGEGVGQMTASGNGLSITSGTPSATVSTTAQGGAYEICDAEAGDTCKAGSFGPGIGQIAAGQGIAVSQPDGNVATGSVFLADPGNQRVDSFRLDGSSPSSFGSAAVFNTTDRPGSIAVDSRGIVYASNQKNGNEIERYDTVNANGSGIGFLSPIPAGVDETQKVTVSATAGQFRLSFAGDTTADLPFNASAAEVSAALTLLPSVGPNAILVSGAASGPYTITFRPALGAKDVPQIVASSGTVPLSGGSGVAVETIVQGQAGLLPFENFGEPTKGLAIDPDADGAGPDTDVLYAIRGDVVQQFGPINQPGLVAAPTADDGRHGTQGFYSNALGLAVEPSTERLYVPAFGAAGRGVYVLGDTSPTPPTASLDSLSGKTSHSITAQATIDPNGPPATSYHFEYSTDGIKWTSTPTVLLGAQEAPQSVEETIDPPPIGLEPNTLYHLRLVFQRRLAFPQTTSELTFTTDPVGPIAETAGSPLRSATSVHLGGRVAPRNAATTYHFEYGTEGPCDSSPCASTPPRTVGSGAFFQLVSEPLEELSPATTYHYRVVAENGIGPAVEGESMTVTTPPPEAALSHGHFPGPPGSDRAWEMVSLPDSGGNPTGGLAYSEDGNRALYSVTGGTDLSDSGSPASQYFAERFETAPHQGGWRTQIVTPSRSQLIGPGWETGNGVSGALGTASLSAMVALNGKEGDLRHAAWRYGPGLEPTKLFEAMPPQSFAFNHALAISEDASTVVVGLRDGTLDPNYPAAATSPNLYEIGSGSPRLISLMPGDTPATCGVSGLEGAFGLVTDQMLSADGRFAFFPSRGAGACDASAPVGIYARDLIAAETELISGPPLSGPLCSAALVKSTPGAVFFWTQSRLTAEDTAVPSCATEAGPDGDVYRYDLDGELDCVTCVVAGFDVDITVNVSGNGELPANEIGVSDDGSRVYFRSPHSLIPGALPNGVYRLRVVGGDLAYAGPIDVDLRMADASSSPIVANPDGSVVLFRSQNSAFNPLGGGTDNGGTSQLYRYDDADKSLVCVSCPRDGSAPRGATLGGSLDDDGNIVAFATPTSLVSIDQNTAGPGQHLDAGQDAYEWRDGRPLLISDGLTNWTEGGAPSGGRVSPDGRDIFFNAYAQYTPDALDAYSRVYDARLGGGFEYPKAIPPCPLEVCQGTPKGVPDEQAPGSSLVSGSSSSSSAPKCRKGKVRRKGRCVAKRHDRRPKPRKAHRDGKHNRDAKSTGRAHR